MGLHRERLENLLLARLLPSKVAKSTLRQDIGKFVEHRLTTSAWQAEFEDLLNGLITDGMVIQKPLAISDAGRNRVASWLGMKTVPARLNWGQLKAKWLAPLAANATVTSDKDRTRLATADGFRAFIVKDEFDLAVEDCPTLSKSIDSLVWKELFGIDSDRKLTSKAIIEAVLAGKLNVSASMGKDRLVAQLPAKILQADQTSPEHLRLAAVRKWLEVDEVGDASAAAQAASGVELATVDAALEAVNSELGHDSPTENEATSTSHTDFAEAALAAARSCESGRFGDRKVFISHVWEQLIRSSRFEQMGIDEFKQRLVDANREGSLALSRADLVEAMSPEDVAASRTEHLNGEFHFVRTDAVRLS